jgi:chorismate-pyruvate lyase
MNRIVRAHYPVSKLPEELREGLEPDGSVTVTLEEEIRKAPSVDEMRQQWLEVRKALKHKVTVEEAVARIRELRDEWDD